MVTQEQQIIEELRIKHGINLEGLIEKIQQYLPEFDDALFRKAFIFAAEAHNGQMRKDEKTPYIVHPFEATQILASLHADETTLIAALLHDVPEDTSRTLEDIEENFGKKVAYLVEGITKLSRVHYRNDMKERQIDSLKKLFIHVAEDARTILIKLADRLHNMRTLNFVEPEKRKRIAKETIEIFVPIANLLGIEEFKTELEDLCFKHLYPEQFAVLSQKMQQMGSETEARLNETIKKIEEGLRKNKIEACVYPSQKNLYFIYQNLQHHHKSIQQLEDFISICVLVREKSECYLALGIIHNIFRPKLKHFQDYIANPKINGYQSLHTTVFGVDGLHTKLQIRTNEMHYEAQYGIASTYFQSKKDNKSLKEDQRAHWVERVLDLQEKELIKEHFLSELKSDILEDRISVFTPIGDTINLPKKATCIDFAYTIHTEVGHRALRAEVNNQNVPLYHALKSGDMVKIIMSEKPKAPSYEWLNFAKTAAARNKMKDYFKKESRAAKINAGKKLLQKEYDRAGFGVISHLSKAKMKHFSKAFPELSVKDFNDILVHISEGVVSPLEFMDTIFHQPSSAQQDKDSFVPPVLGEGAEPTKIAIKIECEKDVDLGKIWEVIKECKTPLTFGKVKYVAKEKVICKSIIQAQNYHQISHLFERLEQVDGVKKVERIFWTRKFLFILASVITFLAWAMHPYLLLYLKEAWGFQYTKNVLITDVALYSGLFLLFFLIIYLKKLTQNSFPKLRETGTLWGIAYILSFFALLTICGEIYILKLQFNWIVVLGSVIGIFGYLTHRYLKYKEQQLQ